LPRDYERNDKKHFAQRAAKPDATHIRYRLNDYGTHALGLVAGRYPPV